MGRFGPDHCPDQVKEQDPKSSEMGENLADIVTAGAEDGEDCVADAALQRASGQTSVGLHVPDPRLNGTSSPEDQSWTEQVILFRGAGMGLHRRPEIAGFLAKAYESLQSKANKTASSLHIIKAFPVVQDGPSSSKIRLVLQSSSSAPNSQPCRDAAHSPFSHHKAASNPVSSQGLKRSVCIASLLSRSCPCHQSSGLGGLPSPGPPPAARIHTRSHPLGPQGASRPTAFKNPTARPKAGGRQLRSGRAPPARKRARPVDFLPALRS